MFGIKELEPVYYKISDNMKKSISEDVENIFQDMVSHNLLDEFSNGTCLDKYINNRFDLVRNDLRKQQVRHLFFIESIENIIKTEIFRIEKERWNSL